MNTRFRMQEWLADRISWMQYPQIRKVQSRPDKPKMSFATAVLVLVFSLVIGCAAIAAFCWGLVLLYIGVTAMFS
jgi:hypothetical protein